MSFSYVHTDLFSAGSESYIKVMVPNAFRCFKEESLFFSKRSLPPVVTFTVLECFCPAEHSIICK